MKKNILIAVFLCISIAINAQIGIKLGGQFTNSDGFSFQKYKFSGFIGGTYDISLSSKWYIQPGVLLTNVGYNLRNDGVILKKGHVSIYGFEVPVNFSFRPQINKNSKFILDMGLWGSYGIFGKKKYEYYDSENVNDSPFDTFNRFNMGLSLGVGMSYKDYYGILSYQRGLTYFDKGENGYLNIFKLGLGYKFHLK